MTELATVEDAGRSCPYCRFALKAGASVTRCPTCDAVHHADCWADNEGCAIVGCAAGPLVPNASRAGADPPAAPRGPLDSPSARTEVMAAADSRRGRGHARRWVVGALGVAAVAAAGAGAAMLATGGGGPAAGAEQAAATLAVTTVETQPSPSTAITATVRTVAGQAAPVARGADRRTRAAGDRNAAITSVVASYYDAVLAGDYDRAWSLLSPTYKDWKDGQGGYAQWQRQETRMRKRLSGGPPIVRVDAFDSASGVATIHVSGYRFKPETDPECDYEGVTWARRINGEWFYDQGYLQNPTRAAKWRPQAELTFGSSCDDSGY